MSTDNKSEKLDLIMKSVEQIRDLCDALESSGLLYKFDTRAFTEHALAMSNMLMQLQVDITNER